MVSPPTQNKIQRSKEDAATPIAPDPSTPPIPMVVGGSFFSARRSSLQLRARRHRVEDRAEEASSNVLQAGAPAPRQQQPLTRNNTDAARHCCASGGTCDPADIDATLRTIVPLSLHGPSGRGDFRV